MDIHFNPFTLIDDCSKDNFELQKTVNFDFSDFPNPLMTVHFEDRKFSYL